jgi:thiol-disulfide isomerase/thioredoxin
VVAGYFLSSDDPNSELETDILTNLTEKLSDTIDFVLLSREEGRDLIVKGMLLSLHPPFFFVFRSKNISANRWWVQGDDALDETKLEAFLGRIVDGSEPFTVIASALPEQADDVLFRQVNALNCRELVYHNESVTLLLLAAPWCHHCKQFKPVIATAADLLKDANIKFYWINAPANDLPTCILYPPGFPLLILFPIGENYTNQIQYSGDRTVPAVVEWIRANGGLEFETAELNETRINEMVDYHREHEDLK